MTAERDKTYDEIMDEMPRLYESYRLMGQFAGTEIRSARGRADAIVKTSDYLFVFGFKLNGIAKEALQQIGERGYLIPFTSLRFCGVRYAEI